ncbi:YceI family protein, partial [Aliarcobacter butzleri]|uniref:YceI family protein n=1 Tax=Aliarcobacter butzleri TaxID=28197 RepID=UPI003AF7CA5B
LAVATALFAGNYGVDASHSNAGFTVKHVMIANVTGKVNDISGSFEHEEKTNKLKSVSSEFVEESIKTAEGKRNGH